MPECLLHHPFFVVGPVPEVILGLVGEHAEEDYPADASLVRFMGSLEEALQRMAPLPGHGGNRHRVLAQVDEEGLDEVPRFDGHFAHQPADLGVHSKSARAFHDMPSLRQHL